MSDSQKQHIIPEVYLKQFSFKVKNDAQEMVCVQIFEDPIIRHKSIKSFNREPNIYDLPFKDIESKRLLEQFNGILETHYPKIISDLENHRGLSPLNEAWLAHIIVNLYCRTISFRNLLKRILQTEIRHHFLLLYVKDEEIIKRLTPLSIDHQINIVLFSVIEELIKRISTFNYTILIEYDGRGWLASDNIVCVKDSETPFFSSESELFLPLSRKYCIYLSHRNSSDKKNNFRSFPNKEMIQSDETIQEAIWDNMFRGSSKYVIHPNELPKGYKLDRE